MKDNDIDLLIKAKINNEKKALPSYLLATKELTFEKLPERSTSQILARKYGFIAVAILLCVVSIAGIKSQLFYNFFSGKRPNIADKTIIEAPIKSDILPWDEPDIEIQDKPNLKDENDSKIITPKTSRVKIDETPVIRIPGKPVIEARDTPSIEPPKIYDEQGFLIENITTSLEKVTGTRDYITFKDPLNGNSVEGLARGSDIIIEGQVIGVKYFEYIDSEPNSDKIKIYTQSKVKVLKSYNSKVKAGDIVTFIEHGGVSSKYDFWVRNNILDKLNSPEQELEKAKGEMVMELGDFGVPVMNPTDKVFIFGKVAKEQYGLTGKIYTPKCDFWGKFTISDEILERFVPAGWESKCDPLKMNIFDMDFKLQHWMNEQQKK